MKSCQHASKNIGLFQNQVFRKKKKQQQPLNNVVQTKTATSTIKKRKEKTSFFCMYIHTRFNIPRSFSPQFYKVVIYMDHDKKVMVLVNTVVRVYTWEEATQRGETGEAQTG